MILTVWFKLDSPFAAASRSQASEEEEDYNSEADKNFAAELKEDESEWKENVFAGNLSSIFSAEFRSRLKEMNFNYLVHHTDELGKFHFILQVNFAQTKNGTTSDMYYFLYFTQFDEVWKLYQIEIAG